MFSANQIVAHLVGDYLLQTHWMATQKTKQSVAAAVHAIVYTLPFLLLTQSPAALAVITCTHFAIDRWRLARLFVWARDQIGPRGNSWCECSATGFPAEMPAWLSVWLLIVTDNVIHILINGFALHFLG